MKTLGRSGVSVAWKVAILREPMKKRTLNGENTAAKTKQRNDSTEMLFFLGSEFCHQRLLKSERFAHTVSGFSQRSISHPTMNLSVALLLRMSSASKALSAGTSTRLRAVGGSARMGSPRLELHVISPKGFLAVLRMSRQTKS